MPFTPLILLDFDGVIHSYTSGWQGVDCIPDAPVPGAIDFILAHLPRPFNLGGNGDPAPQAIVQIYSSRSHSAPGRVAMRDWLIHHGIHAEYFAEDILKFPTEKPPAWLTIDDRAWCFQGTFPTDEELVAFQPWYKQTAVDAPSASTDQPDMAAQQAWWIPTDPDAVGYQAPETGQRAHVISRAGLALRGRIKQSDGQICPEGHLFFDAGSWGQFAWDIIAFWQPLGQETP